MCVVKFTDTKLKEKKSLNGLRTFVPCQGIDGGAQKQYKSTIH